MELEVLNNFGIGSKRIGRRIRSQIHENQRVANAIFCRWMIFFNFVTKRFIWLSWTEKTFDRFLRELSIGVYII